MFVNVVDRGWLVGLLLAVALPVHAQAPDAAPGPDATAAPDASPAPAGAELAPAGQHSRVLLATSQGDITLELFDDKAPTTVANFLQYVRAGFYDGIAFHRVKKDFMIQAGGYNADLSPRTSGVRAPITNESGNLLRNERGTIAMARMSDPHSATTEFFINVVDNPHLDRSRRQPYGYAVFGKVVEGMEVVDAIQHAPVIQHPQDPRKGADGPVNPNPPITIKEATVLAPVPVEAAPVVSPEGEAAAEPAPSAQPESPE